MQALLAAETAAEKCREECGVEAEDCEQTEACVEAERLSEIAAAAVAAEAVAVSVATAATALATAHTSEDLYSVGRERARQVNN